MYDGDGNRLYKATGTTPTKIYWCGAGTEILDESDGSGNITAEYAFFGGKRVAMDLITSGSISSTYYYADDFLGSSRTMVQAGGTAPCFDADFLPFGREKDNVDTCAVNSYKFEGRERDAETGNDDFGARYYSSNFGRWLSPDWSSIPEPVPYANLTNPQTLNLYAMVQDNPESFADLDGHVVSGDPKNGYCNVVNGDGACDDGELGTIFNNRLSAAPMNPAQLAAFIDYVGQADEPYAYDPAIFNPHNATDRADAQAKQAQSESPQTADAFPLTLPAAAASAGASSGLLEFLITASAALRVGGVVVGVGDFFFNAPSTAPASVDELSPTILKEEAEKAAAPYGSTPEGRPFTKHYGTETGPERNIPGSVVDHVVDTAAGVAGRNGTTVHYDPDNNVTVVTGTDGSIVSVHKGAP